MRHGLEHRTDFRAIEGHDVTRASFEAHVAVLLAGIAAEEVLLGSRGSGSGGTADADLTKATQLVAAAECSLGLGQGLVSLPLEVLAGRVTALEEPRLRARIDRVLGGCLQTARTIVERRRSEVEALSVRLAKDSDVRMS